MIMTVTMLVVAASKLSSPRSQCPRRSMQFHNDVANFVVPVLYTLTQLALVMVLQGVMMGMLDNGGNVLLLKYCSIFRHPSSGPSLKYLEQVLAC